MELKIGATIKRLRNGKKITQEELAEYLGVSFQAVSKWETDTTLPDISLLPKMALFFGVTIDDLFSVDMEDELDRIDYMLANKQISDENFYYAKKILDSILSKNKEDVTAIKRYANLLLKRINRDALDAGSLLERAMSLVPLDPEIFMLYRLARGGNAETFRSGNDWFIRVCEPFAVKYPANSRLCEQLVEAMIDTRYFDQAESLISHMKTAGGYPEKLAEILKGDLVLAKGDGSDAVRIWEQVESDDPKTLYELGERFNRVCAYEKAIECYQKSFRLDHCPRDLSAVYSLAFLYAKLKRYGDAISAWQCILDVLASDHQCTKGESVDWPKREIAKLKNML